MTSPRHGDITPEPAATESPQRLPATDVGGQDRKEAHRRFHEDLFAGAERNISGVYGVYEAGGHLELRPLEALTEQAGPEVLNTGPFLDVLKALLPVALRHDCGVDPIGLCGIAIGRHFPAKTGNPRAWECSAVAEGWLHTVWWHPRQARCQPFLYWAEPGKYDHREPEAARQILDALTSTSSGEPETGGDVGCGND
jgi:hypothetical protein